MWDVQNEVCVGDNIGVGSSIFKDDDDWMVFGKDGLEQSVTMRWNICWLETIVAALCSNPVIVYDDVTGGGWKIFQQALSNSVSLNDACWLSHVAYCFMSNRNSLLLNVHPG